eukprot:228220-Amphidinium_carterae.1
MVWGRSASALCTSTVPGILWVARSAFSRIWATTPAYRRREADALSLSSSARMSARALCSST